MKSPIFKGLPKKNDALFIFGSRQDLPFVYTYKQERTEIVYGPACNPENEINTDLCISDSVSVVKRRGGGGTVILSPGVVVTLIVGKRNGKTALEIFDNIHDSMISLLGKLGVKSVEKKGISDLAIKNRKILGSSLYLGSDPQLYYYQSSLMVQSDSSLMDKYLKHPPKEPNYRKNRPHSSFCTTICQQKPDINPDCIVSLFNEAIGSML
ncbi:MAG: hypothetical protein Q4F84_05815 [Fibrobacter sp.]|nr:hypothetical protein [Fibrobacter sp.]